MTIAIQVNSKTFAAVAGTTPVPINFPFAAPADLIVTEIDADGVPRELTLNSHYSITGDGRAVAGALVPINLVAGLTHRIDRRTALVQPYNPQNGVAGDARALENTLDDMAMRAQDTARDVADTRGRALMVPAGEAGAILPALDVRKGKLLGFDAVSGAPSLTVIGDAVDGAVGAVEAALEGYVDSAATSAASAAQGAAAALEAASLVAAARAAFGGVIAATVAAGVAVTPIGGSFLVMASADPYDVSVYTNTDGTAGNAAFVSAMEFVPRGIIRANLAPYNVGKAGNTPTQNSDGINAAVQDAIARHAAGKGVWEVQLPGGLIPIADTVKLFKHATGTTNLFSDFALRLSGGGGYAGSSTTLQLQSRDRPVVAIQAGKGVYLKGIKTDCVGANVTAPSVAALLADHYATGGRTNEFSPDCGFSIDPYSTGHAAGEQYPGHSAFYTHNRGSNNVYFDDCYAYGTTVGWAVGLSRNTRNCDGIRWLNCRAYNVHEVIAVGHDQTRDMQVYSMWVNFATRMVNTRNWGLGIGVCPTFYGGQLTVGKEFMIIGTDRNSASIHSMYLENVWRLGYAGGSMPVEFTNLVAKLASAENSVANPDAHVHMASPATFTGCSFYYNNDLPDAWNFMLEKPYRFENCHFDDSPTLWQPSSSIKPDGAFVNCTIRSVSHGPTYGVSDEIRGDITHIVTADVPFRKGARWLDNAANATIDHKVFESLGAQPIVLDAAAVLDTNGTGGATFTSGNAAGYHVGQYVQTGTSWNIAAYGNLAVIATGGGNYMSIGKVVSVDTGTGLVTLDHVPMGIVDGGTYQIADARIPKLRARVVGTGTIGTNTVTLNSSSHGFKVGDRIRTLSSNPQGAFAAGTRVTAVAGAVLTLSHNLVATIANVPVFDALYVPVSLRRSYTYGKPTTGLWWPGDFFKVYGNVTEPNLTGYRVLGANPLVAIPEYTTPRAAAVAGTSYTPTPDDFQRIVEFSATSAVTVTLPTAASMNIAWEPGRRFRFIPAGAGGSVIAAAGAGVTLQQANGTLTQANQHRSLIAEMTATTNTYRITTDA